ncbi:hypothetical protein AD954_09270 [Acetobacter cerevisiae]|uniref:Uncharacterized protein n=1 Tax=Acetobacter cerevisiae TaxID=178900 RepID=A0A149VA84_9PROT|nr:hypothetical protein AD954_09270 [Acetobacter cerevisiae]
MGWIDEVIPCGATYCSINPVNINAGVIASHHFNNCIGIYRNFTWVAGNRIDAIAYIDKFDRTIFSCSTSRLN